MACMIRTDHAFAARASDRRGRVSCLRSTPSSSPSGPDCTGRRGRCRHCAAGLCGRRRRGTRPRSAAPDGATPDPRPRTRDADGRPGAGACRRPVGRSARRGADRGRRPRLRRAAAKASPAAPGTHQGGGGSATQGGTKDGAKEHTGASPATRTAKAGGKGRRCTGARPDSRRVSAGAQPGPVWLSGRGAPAAARLRARLPASRRVPGRE